MSTILLDSRLALMALWSLPLEEDEAFEDDEASEDDDDSDEDRDANSSSADEMST